MNHNHITPPPPRTPDPGRQNRFLHIPLTRGEISLVHWAQNRQRQRFRTLDDFGRRALFEAVRRVLAEEAGPPSPGTSARSSRKIPAGVAQDFEMWKSEFNRGLRG